MGECKTMRGKALHWMVDESNSNNKLMHADLLKARYVITFDAGEFWLHTLFEGKDGLKSGPFKTPWQAMEKAEVTVIKALYDSTQVP
jgi:hypothetical protein